ncbi:hypothetical protein [Winogradskyella forsetii]|uniref:hypothetical protein n=1 Tax=Winogradskyella forsetii TaxID=2686077 RepID=UPI0015BAA8D0|nr:hypothetical protein [Winogradskyella forsetii]
MDYNKFNAKELNDMVRTFASLRAEVESNSDLFRIQYDDEAEICIEYMDFSTEYFFTISVPKLEGNYVWYELNFQPESNTSNLTTTVKQPSKDNRVLNQIKQWMGLVRNIHNVKQNIHPNSKNVNHYQEKIFESFGFLKDENDDKPLDPKRQEELSDFLNVLIQNFEKDDGIEEEIVNELKSLNESIPQLTQLQIKNYITFTFAKLMYSGVGALKRIIKVGTDAGIGQLFIEGLKTFVGG